MDSATVATTLPVSGIGPIKSAGPEVGVPKNGSHISSSATASSKDSSDGKREETQTLAGFDALRFKNSFLEMVEELRLLRTLKYENENQIEQLLTEKHELTHKLDEAISHGEALKESNGTKLQALAQKHEEQLQEHKAEQAKGSASQLSREKELKALKDEMRALHLTKHVLEKKVQEQERQIQLHFSSRDDYLSKMTQLEEKCSSLFKMAEDTSEHVERLEANVKQAKELHCRLEYVNTHQNCELQEVRLKLESCHKELIESRASRRMELGAVQNADSQDCTAKLKTAQQELKMQTELCQHLQTQLSLLRAEHNKCLNQIKEGHVLLERHVETANRAVQDEEKLKKNCDDLQADVQLLEDKASMAERDCRILREKCVIDKADLDKKLLDMEQRLTTLQSDYKLLQDSYDHLEASREDMKGRFEMEREELEAKCVQLEEDTTTAKNVSRELSERIRNLQSALDQSELQLAACEEKLQEKSEVSSIKVYEGGRREVFVRASPVVADNPEFSPEVIPSLTGDESYISTAVANSSIPGNTGVKGTCEMPCEAPLKEQGSCSTQQETNFTEGSGSLKINQVDEDKHRSSISKDKSTDVDSTEESGPHKDSPAKERGSEEDTLDILRKELGICCNKEGKMYQPPEDPTPCEMDIPKEVKTSEEPTLQLPEDCHTSGSGQQQPHPNEMPRNTSGSPMCPCPQRVTPPPGISQTGQNDGEDNTVQIPLPKKIKLDPVVMNRGIISSPLTGSEHDKAGPRHSTGIGLEGDGRANSSEDRMRLPQCGTCIDIEVEGLKRCKTEGGEMKGMIEEIRDEEACPKLVPELKEGGATYLPPKGAEHLDLSPKDKEGAGEERFNLSPKKKGGECSDFSSKLCKGIGEAGGERLDLEGEDCANFEGGQEECIGIPPKGKLAEEVCPSEFREGGEEVICPNSSEEKGEDILFSPDFGHGMCSTQMNRQINRVESFLKMDRLRREKPFHHQ